MQCRVYLAAIAALMVGCVAPALGATLDVAIIDRDSGARLSTHYFRGEYWVAGRPGAKYAIEIRNRTGERLLAVTSVDGVNVLSGQTAGWDQAGYVFDPWEQYQIAGWRKSNAEVADFTFTGSPNSYAARTGRPENVGVIGVAIFRERPPAALYVPPNLARPEQDDERLGAREQGLAAAPLVRAPPAPATRLGTGHGEREYSYVVDTEFRRLQSEPNELIRLRYDSLENLVAMGVIRRTRPLRSWPDAFPGSPQAQFVPDPPG